jgi:apolipoprotein D and lipocalin family protein
VHQLIRTALLAAPLVLSACLGTGARDGQFRAETTPIWSAAAFDAAALAGGWQQVAGFATQAGGCNGGALQFAPDAGGFAVTGSLCLNGKATKINARATPNGPGRLAVSGQEDWWVLWVDSGYRTLAIGTPSGSFGFVLDRGAIPQDRLAAAREVFDFNGYATGALQPF